MVIERNFSGHLNLDAHPFRVLPNDYIDALNITRSGDSEEVISNLVGNRMVSFTFPGGTNICVGAKEDKTRNRIIEFIYNSNGFHTILIFNKATRIRTKVFQSRTDSNDIDILNLQPLYKVKDIDIVYRDSDGDLVFFNDGYNRPGGFNIDTISNFAPAITDDLIRLAKRPPLTAPLTAYKSDTSVKVNNLRKKLFQFIYRIGYYDNYTSTWSPISKVVLPVEGYSIVTDTDPTQNNYISIQGIAGGADFKYIQIAARQSLGDTWSDFFLIDTLDRTDYDLEADDTFTYNFYNDGAYPTLDPDEVELKFDSVPDLANTQALANGNVLTYAGITEGYNRLPRSQTNVQVSYKSVDTSPNPTPVGPPSISWFTQSSPSMSPTDYRLFITIEPFVSGGAKYHVEFISVPVNGVTYTLNVEYTALNTDTITTVRDALRNAIDAALGPNFTVQNVSTNQIKIETHVSPSVGGGFYTSVNIYAVGALTSQGSNGTWKWNSRYEFALIYFDTYGKPITIVNYKPLAGDVNVFSVTTPNFNINGANSNAPRVPVITASIGHLPPANAKYFQWLRTTNLSVSKFLHYVTCQVDEDSDYIYFCIENLEQFRAKNSGFVPSYTFTPGDRIRVMNTVDISSGNFEYSGSYFQDDYEIVGTVQRNIPSAGIDGKFIKVRRPSPATSYNAFMLVEIYTPALRTNTNAQVFYEFGEVYPIYLHANGTRYHTGNVANQNAVQNAHFEFIDGDVYFKFRKIYNDTFSETLNFMMLGMMDANYSDYWQSNVNSNGRPWVIEANAKRTYNPVLIRFGNSFQQGTDINALNRFYPNNYDEYVRDYGDVMKMFAWNNTLIVCQKFKIGRVPVLQQIWEDAEGADTVGVSQKLLNRIQYYIGEYGVGDVPESVAYNNSIIIGYDSARGIQWRISQNGLTAISIIKNVNTFTLREAGARGFAYKIYGAYNSSTNEYVGAMEATNALSAKTLVWDEKSEGYRSFVSYQPEWMCCLNGLFVAWKNGQLYTFDGPTYNNFFGVQYESSITGVFGNESAKVRKNFNDLFILAGQKWDMPLLSTNVKSTTAPGSPVQMSNIIEDDFEEIEGAYYTDLKGDINSVSAGNSIDSGDYLKGAYIIIKTRKSSSGANVPVFLNSVIVGVTESPYNNKQ